MNELKLNLLYFINATMRTVLSSLSGSFEKNTKYKFNKVVNSAEHLEKELLRGCEELAHETYSKASVMVAEVLNEAITAYNDNELNKFVEHCKNFKSGTNR